ncbi:hypothetical protein UFOVP327_29 [uncultured Caudovirales phage]|jgi:hypothetical protein|uniref:Uncharacterized protein n=1 Tax=uncultured Caudovirales phage TaxID=2100421 RepID=A0A6J5LSB6_9CAUD|nr:hypothetical protein UFOVP327_29 [uncultured Caudovirales phage]
MILTLDNLACRYNVLPSEALGRATTFDLHVMDTAVRHQRHQQARAELEQDLKSGRARPVAPPTQDQMKAMLDRVKELK